jgi:2-oxoglutarate dehydrogenase complex dihydrolipoamide succinyltransferase (E2) component
MSREFKLPDLGEGVAEGEIVKWLVHEGDAIKEDQPMVEVMTDKATVQIPSPTTGKVGKIVAKEGETVKVGSVLVSLDDGENGGSTTSSKSPTSEPQRPSSPQSGQSISQSRSVSVIAPPSTRKLARELNVNLELIQGSGPGGRITDDDVRGYPAGAKQQLVPPAQVAQTSPPKITGESSIRSLQSSTSAMQKPLSSNREERVPIHGIRKRIAEKMAKSVHTAAHVTHIDEVDFTQLIALREKAKPLAESQNVKLTFLPFIMKAAISALKEYPYFNASIDDEKQEIIIKNYYNIGFATDTSNGLLVPNVKDVDRKSVLQIAKEVEELSAKAREGKISLEEIQGGTFTITNIGTLGGMISTPIINTPEVAILGVHKIQKKPVVRDNQIVIRDVTFVSLSFDHRVVDGADAARFTTKLISMLENPGLFIFETGQ